MHGEIKAAHYVWSGQNIFLLILTGFTGFTALDQASTYRTRFDVIRSDLTTPDQIRFLTQQTRFDHSRPNKTRFDQTRSSRTRSRLNQTRRDDSR